MRHRHITVSLVFRQHRRELRSASFACAAMLGSLKRPLPAHSGLTQGVKVEDRGVLSQAQAPCRASRGTGTSCPGWRSGRARTSCAAPPSTAPPSCGASMTAWPWTPCWGTRPRSWASTCSARCALAPLCLHGLVTACDSPNRTGSVDDITARDTLGIKMLRPGSGSKIFSPCP